MDAIKTEPTLLTTFMLPLDSFIQFPGDEASNQNLPTLMKIKKETFDFDDEFHNLINPSTLANHQTDNAIKIKTEPFSIQALRYHDNELFSEPFSSKIFEAKKLDELNLKQLSQSTIKHESIDIKIESHDELESTPTISDLESTLISIKDEDYGKLDDFEVGDKEFVSPQNLSRHCKEVPERNKDYTCKIRKKIFSRKENLKLHEQLVHLKVRNFKCTHCDKSFSTKSSLKRHEKTVHLNIRELKCNFCDKYFTNKSNLKIHEKAVHLKIRTWKCDICNKYFSQSNHLKVHEKSVHLKIRDWKCNYCDKYFTTKSSLKVHENEVHLNIRNWKCNICEKSFASKSALKIHSIVHVSDYSEVCDICNKTVRYLRAHKRYMHSKTRAENLKCAHCDKVFLKKSNLKQHMIIHSDARN